ncbi:MAG: endolytic transglycosylase MltG [Rickettsiales bacterium]|nr:endolytic transglycosylase MltG [Rickettsiales bacterium]
MVKKITFSIFAISVFTFLLLFNSLNSKVNLTDEFIYEVKNGQTSVSVIKNLQKLNILSDNSLYLFLIKIENKTFGNINFKTGEYLIKPGDSFLNLIKKFNNNDAFQRKITFPEGLSNQQTFDIIESNQYLSGKITIKTKEGYLFPDTYYFSKNMPRNDLIKIMQNRTDNLLNDYWNKYNNNIPFKSKEEVLIMASIIEKETGHTDERDLVSGVFYNRINKNMRLQSDPTVIYSITKGQYQLNRPLSKRDLRTPSKFNTYRNRGLPPTPIANPGYKAIYAAFNPAKTNYIYFVANGEGGHNFATNLKDHNKNVRILRKIERLRKSN